MKLAMRKMLHGLPAPVLGKLRSIRDQISIHTFRPKIVRHSYGGIQLRVNLADSISARWYDRDTPEPPEITFLKRTRLRVGALAFDLGAHQGVIALCLSRIVGPSGRVVAVEGGRYNYDLAIQNKKLNDARNLSIVRGVVANQAGILTPFRDGINGSVIGSGEEVISCSIDALASEYGRPDVVILDLEGYECRALEGATQTLKGGVDWCVEVHSGCGLESFGGSSKHVAGVFRDNGYELYCLTDEYGGNEFRLMSTIPGPGTRFFLIAVRN
jgi:FkbM family methyltransferase